MSGILAGSPIFEVRSKTVTLRTANETAEAVEFINHEYLIKHAY